VGVPTPGVGVGVAVPGVGVGVIPCVGVGDGVGDGEGGAEQLHGTLTALNRKVAVAGQFIFGIVIVTYAVPFAGKFPLDGLKLTPGVVVLADQARLLLKRLVNVATQVQQFVKLLGLTLNALGVG